MGAVKPGNTAVMPEAVRGGKLIPTLNNHGWMVTSNVEPVPAFIQTAAKSPLWSLDIGCAYGIHTLAALDGGAKMVALDLEQQHLDILRSQTPAEKQDKLTTVCGAFPQVELPHAPYAAILACRVLHFLDGPTLQLAARTMFDLLAPNGMAYVRTMSPYLGINQKILPEYEERKARGERFPGWMCDLTDKFTDPDEVAVCPKQAHFFEPEILAIAFMEAGFVIEKAEFFAVDVEPYKLDGREAVVVIARKP
jgi:2-polyprenyl-3-methyl-5-hydroxy-6-metoxy-1,4-benzoquinol methylase